jgi:hypothetical protein
MQYDFKNILKKLKTKFLISYIKTMYKKLLGFLIVLAIFVICVIIFALIYHSYNKNDPDPDRRSFTHALYTSVTIQTTIGLTDPPNSDIKSLQIWVIVQSIITYLIGLGLVFIVLKSFEKDDDVVELRIEKQLQEMKLLIKELHGKK